MALAFVLLTGLACGGSGAPATPTVTAPPLDPRLIALSDGRLTLNIAAGAGQEIDPLALARAAGTPPTCADFVFLFSWQTTEAPGVQFVGNRMGGTFDIAQGRAGQASVTGCILLEAVSIGNKRVEGDLRYIIATPLR